LGFDKACSVFAFQLPWSLKFQLQRFWVCLTSCGDFGVSGNSKFKGWRRSYRAVLCKPFLASKCNCLRSYLQLDSITVFRFWQRCFSLQLLLLGCGFQTVLLLYSLFSSASLLSAKRRWGSRQPITNGFGQMWLDNLNLSFCTLFFFSPGRQYNFQHLFLSSSK
jgi:hypothetical protein